MTRYIIFYCEKIVYQRESINTYMQTTHGKEKGRETRIREREREREISEKQKRDRGKRRKNLLMNMNFLYNIRLLQIK